MATPTVEDYLRELDKWRDRLANFLTEKGIESSENEKFNSLVPKVLSISGESGGAVPVVAKLGTIIPEAEAITENAIYSFVPESKWNFWQEANGNAKTVSSVTASPTAECLLLLAVMHRDEITVDGEEWKHVITSKVADPEDTKQRISVYTRKISVGGEYVCTVNQASESRMNLKVIALYETESISVVDNTLLSTTSYTPTATTGKRRLYLLSSVFAGSSNAITVSSSGDLDLRMAEETRFSVFYDYQPELQTTPVFSLNVSDYDADTANAITLDIVEV